ncbi:MAG: tetratricopeptide repeat protein, partial [Algicola sp.]|nr:tetratricopeptide repeat protein [Algicola sp.]
MKKLLAVLGLVGCCLMAQAQAQAQVKESQFELIEQSNRFYQQNQFSQAITSLEKLTALNSLNGRYWYRLASSYYETNQNQLAIKAYQQAAKLGYQKAYASYNIASCYGKLGNAQQAVHWLLETRKYKMSELEQRLMADNDFDSVRSSKTYRQQIFPKLPDNATRAQKWQTDLEFFSTRMLETHYQLFTHFDKAFWDKSVNNLKSKVTTLADHQIYLSMVKLIALLKDGHSFVIPPFGGITHFHTIPVRFGMFSDGVYVQAASQQYSQLVGQKVVSINGSAIVAVLAKVKTLHAGDNEYGAQWVRTRWLLNVPEILHALNIGDSKTDITVTVAGEGGKHLEVKVTGDLLNPGQFNLIEQPKEWKIMAGEVLWQQQPETNYWFTHLPESKLVYFKFNRVRNDKSRPLADFIEQVLTKVSQTPSKALVIDLRSNSGGNGALNNLLVHALLKSEVN